MRGPMRKILVFLLSFGFLAPGLRAEDTPQLPDTKEQMEEAPKDEGPVKDVETPEGELLRQDSVTANPVKPARFHLRNLVIGALGGAVFGGGIAILFFSKDEKTGGLDRERLPVNRGIGAGAGALIGGLLGSLLGATTPSGPLPPDMHTRWNQPLPPLAVSRADFGIVGPYLAISAQF